VVLRLVQAPHQVASQRAATVTVRLRQGRRAVHRGRLLLRVDGRTVRRVRLTHRNHARLLRLALPGLGAGRHSAAVLYRAGGRTVAVRRWTVTAYRGCAAAPSRCGYPDATTTGVRPQVTLRRYARPVTITTDGATFQNAVVPSLEVQADNVTIRNVRITDTGEGWGIGLRGTRNTHIDHVEILPAGARLLVGIKDVTGSSTGTTITHTEIARTTTGIQTHEGLIADNYIHDMALQEGDHLNGTTSNGSTEPLTIRHNTILNQHDQTDAISLFQDFGPEGNRTITDNLLAGGGYTIYAGGYGPHPTFNIKITHNRISRIYFPQGGSYGPLAKWEDGPGNLWAHNVWDDTGAAITP
jgi:hypothetical protein